MTAHGQKLLEELAADSASFREKGLACSLLDEYFEGHPFETLEPFLLEKDDVDMVRAAIWVASELGREALPLLPAVASIVDSQDRFVRYHALEVVGVCAPHADAGLLALVFAAMSDEDQAIRRVAMRLLCFMPKQELASGMSSVDPLRFPGLSLLEPGTAAADISRALADSNGAGCRFACVAACRRRIDAPELLAAAIQHADEEVRSIAQEIARARKGSA